MNIGKLYLVGLGPGDAGHLTPAAAAAIADSDELVGYRYYIEQVAEPAYGKTLHSMELGQELERAALAVDIAYAGKTVAVVSSGDAGIYGMAGPVYRVLTDRDWDGANPRRGVGSRSVSPAIGGGAAGVAPDAGLLRHQPQQPAHPVGADPAPARKPPPPAISWPPSTTRAAAGGARASWTRRAR